MAERVKSVLWALAGATAATVAFIGWWVFVILVSFA